MYRTFELKLSMSGYYGNASFSNSNIASGVKWSYEKDIHDERYYISITIKDVYNIDIDTIINSLNGRDAVAMKVSTGHAVFDSIKEFFADDITREFEIDSEFSNLYFDMDAWSIDYMILEDTGVSLI